MYIKTECVIHTGHTLENTTIDWNQAQKSLYKKIIGLQN